MSTGFLSEEAMLTRMGFPYSLICADMKRRVARTSRADLVHDFAGVLCVLWDDKFAKAKALVGHGHSIAREMDVGWVSESETPARKERAGQANRLGRLAA
jgi:hypothetical protein